MSVNRMLYVLIVLALAVGTFFTFQQAIAAGAIARADPSYNQTEMMRGSRGINPNLLINEQPMTTSGTNELIADRSYDAIENLRTERQAK
jgi:hypothetical protein